MGSGRSTWPLLAAKIVYKIIVFKNIAKYFKATEKYHKKMLKKISDLKNKISPKISGIFQKNMTSKKFFD